MMNSLSPLYFDYNASAPLLPKAKRRLMDMLDVTGNASSPHFFGRKARLAIEQTRALLAELLKSPRPDCFYFNSGCTEGNNTILKTFKTMGAHILASPIEHACVLESAPGLETFRVDEQGVVDLGYLDARLRSLSQGQNRNILVSMMIANNETGVLQPYDEFLELCKRYNAYVHMDAAQALCRIPLDLNLYPVDYLTVSSHKIGGPTGVGAIYIKPGAPIDCLIHGGGQEKAVRSGTHNTAAIASFGAALESLSCKTWKRCEQIRNQLEEDLLKFNPKVRIWSKDAPRLANTSSIYMPDVNAQTQLMSFDMDCIAISAGAACSSGKTSVSHTLKAFDISDDFAQNTIRVSMSHDVTPQDTERFIKSWKTIFNRVNVNK